MLDRVVDTSVKMKILIFLLVLTATAMAVFDVEQVMKTANDQFTAKMFYEVAKNNPDESCVLSAYSVMSPLAQLALASVGSSHNEILQVIGMPNDNVTKEVFAGVNTRLGSVKGIELKQANKVYVRTGYLLNEKFGAISKDVFNSEVQNINFSNQEAAANEINKWVEDHTNQRIKQLVDPTTLTNDTAAVLVNAIYFKGRWKVPFMKANTQDLMFHVNKDNIVPKPMMRQSDSFKYAASEELNSQVLKMAYEGDETSFVVILPNEYYGVDVVIEKLKEPAAFSNALKSLSQATVDVTLPKFKIETKTDLKKILSKININKLFCEKLAQLNNLVKGEKGLYISTAVQKAFIEVNEEGAEAAAANYFAVAFATSVRVQHVQKFKADHPFLFYIMEKDNILFNGVYRS